ncbi:MAG: hypothetical protein CMB26_04130 [Euryarchaeota archaeon]|nr:hypothetical protein [Euryarchaeota archaeon]DAC62480.1 MAG TPA: hypothetical protein D7I10_03930 [Candidatus Poseidoniales archaeon]HIH81572.1 hypothetical protein [Candidatus Thalassarchaeaceae archaeon]
MDTVDLVILLLHPIAAILVIGWIFQQQRKRQRDRRFKSDESITQGYTRQKERDRIYKLTWFLVISGFIANFSYNIRSGDANLQDIILPAGVGGLHTLGGVFGIALLTYLRIRKRGPKSSPSENSESEENRTGWSLYDTLMLLVVIHAFLGFLWLFELLV